jgi:hypothetical protein
MTKPLAIFHCPSRRAAGLYPYHGDFDTVNFDPPINAAKCDDAANCGDQDRNDMGGPRSASVLTSPKSSDWSGYDPKLFTGVCFGRSAVNIRQITDGTSHTYMAGEKHVDGKKYETGWDNADNEAVFAGFDNDTLRVTGLNYPPLHDQAGIEDAASFGAVHSEIFNMVFCDGSVHAISFEIANEAHRRLGTKAEGKLVQASEYEK